jgi:hypothetical protein
VDLETLANLGEFVGGIFVVVSLVYLALQVRQNTESLRAENYARVLERISAIQSQLSRESDLADLVTRGLVDASALTPAERIRLTWAFYENFGAFEFMFHQARAGGLPADVWERWAATIAWWLTWPGLRAWWGARPAPFSASFAAFVDGLLADLPVDRDAARRWQAFVEAGAGADPTPRR